MSDQAVGSVPHANIEWCRARDGSYVNGPDAVLRTDHGEIRGPHDRELVKNLAIPISKLRKLSLSEG
jgi:hypothetical protein